MMMHTIRLRTGLNIQHFAIHARGLSTQGGSNKAKQISSSLKKMMKPFFLKCHPDLQTSNTSKKVNMEALQNLNGFMDTLDATCNGKVVDWPATSSIPIVFLLKTEEITARKKKSNETITRRKVELVVPSVSLRDTIVSSKEGPARSQSIQRLLNAVQIEFAKVLQIAGLEVPNEFDGGAADPDFWDGVLEHEVLNDGGSGGHPLGRRFAADTEQQRPKTKYEESRQRFVRSLDQEKFKKMYNEALKDLEADMATAGLVKNDAKLRQDLINKIIAKVRINKDADIVMLDQLMTCRRLSLILEDNFETLHMEEFGRMWEELTLILTDPRAFGTSETALHKRRKRGQESGFQFTYGVDNRVTIHVPIDFRDEELMTELDRNLWDWFNMVDDGAEDLFRYKS